MNNKLTNLIIEKYRHICNKCGYTLVNYRFIDGYTEYFKYGNEAWEEYIAPELTIIIKNNNRGKKASKKFENLEIYFKLKYYKKHGYGLCPVAEIIEE